jgi:hypothetical protein
MRINSPIGKYPFTMKKLKIEHGRVALKGAMGAWPTTVELELSDISQFARIFWWPLALTVLLTLVALTIAVRRRF